jgi:hypothetical protein
MLSVVTIMDEATRADLDELRELLLCLPESLPRALFTFKRWRAEGEHPAEELNQHLERKLGSRKNGLKLPARGPGIVSVVDLLEHHLRQSPDDIILNKWVQDLKDGARSLGVVRTSHIVRTLLNTDT